MSLELNALERLPFQGCGGGGPKSTENSFPVAMPLMATFTAQTVKNLPAMQETRVQSLGREDPLEKGMATQSSILG